MMKSILYTLTLLFSFTSIAQQQQFMDSTLREIQQILEPENKFDAYQELFSKTYNQDVAFGKKALDSMEIYIPENDNLRLGIYKRYQAIYESRISNLDTAIALSIEAIDLLDASGSALEKAKALGNLAVMKRRQGYNEEAISYALQSLRIKDSIGVPQIDTAFDYNTIASIYGDLKKFKESNRYFNIAKKIYVAHENKTFASYMDINLGTNHAALGNFEKSEQFLISAKHYFESNNDTFTTTTIYLELGILYLKSEAFPKAIKNLKKVIANHAILNHNEILAEAYQTLSEVYLKTGALNDAIFYLNKAIAINVEAGAVTQLADDYNILSKVYFKKDDYKNAYRFSLMHKTISDSLAGVENLKSINTLKIQYETEKKDAALQLQRQEIELLEKNNKLQTLTKTLYAIGMFSLLIIAGLLYFGLKQKIKKKQIENEKQREIYERELNFKRKELASQTLHLVKKNTFIQELKENLERIKNAPETFQSELRRMMLLLKREASEDKDWEVFKSYFSQVHNAFGDRLKNLSSVPVTEKEMRLASFLRMNLSTKEIASMFNVLPDSVLTSKYRLKKKLNIPKDKDLTLFLHQL